MARVFVVSLVGEPGVGKSHIWSRLRKYVRLEEGFTTNPKDPLPPQGFTRELAWVVDYYERIRLAARPALAAPGDQPMVIVTDRSPYSGCVFTETHREMMQQVTAVLEQRHKDLGIEFVRVRVTAAEVDVLERVRERLQKEPWRLALHEDDPAHIRRIRGLYDELSCLWDFVVENGNADSSEGARQVQEIIAGLVSD